MRQHYKKDKKMVNEEDTGARAGQGGAGPSGRLLGSETWSLPDLLTPWLAGPPMNPDPWLCLGPWVKYRQSAASPPRRLCSFSSLFPGFFSLPIRLQRERVGGEEMESRNVSETLNRVCVCSHSPTCLDFPLLHRSPSSSSSHLLYIYASPQSNKFILSSSNL